MLVDAPDGLTGDSIYGEIGARCYRVLPCNEANVAPNVYIDWDAGLSSMVMSSGKKALGGYDWSIKLHGMKGRYSNNELGHDFVEGQGVIYDFFKWGIFRIRKNDLDWQVFDLKEFFGEFINQARDSVPLPVLHRGAEAWYYALLFEYKMHGSYSKRRYRLRIVEISRKGEKVFLWSFPDFNVTKKLTTFPCRSPGIVHKLQDDSWVFLSNTGTYTNDAIFVQRMTGSRKEIQPAFKSIEKGMGRQLGTTGPGIGQDR